MMENELHEIKLPKCLLVLTRGELISLLKHDPNIWQRGLKRGKALRRARQTAKREKKLFDTRGN